MSSLLYETEPFTLAQNAVYTLASEVDSFAIISATFGDNIEISTGNGQGFFPFPSDGSLEFPAPTVVRVRNTNAGANTIIVGSGSAKFRRNLSSGGIVIVSGTVSVTIADGGSASLGAKADAAAASDAGAYSLIALFKRGLQQVTLMLAALVGLSAKFGALVKTAFTLDTLATTNSNLIAAGARRVYSLDVFNASMATLYVRLYDKATAPTVGTDVAKRVYAIPTLTNIHLVWAGEGDPYTLGLGLAVTAGAAYNDATAVAAHDAQITAVYE